MTTIPIDADGAIRRSSVVAQGLSATVLYRAAAAGEVERIGSGLYVPTGAQRPDARHRLKLADTRSSPRSVLSHTSAAILHGLPMLKPDLRDVHLTVAADTVRSTSEFRQVHVAALAPEEIVAIDGHCATTLERTAVDVAASTPMGFAGALAVFDAALRLGAQPELMADLIRRGTGGPAVRHALRHSSPRPDGVGESWCRAQILASGLPRPRLKHPLHDVRGTLIAEPDMDWDGAVLAEFDGSVRLERIRVPGDSTLTAAWRAVVRDERLRRRGIRVLRFTWADLERHDVVAPCRYRLNRAGLLGSGGYPTAGAVGSRRITATAGSV